jgi:REP-associated tyrosine transposase
MAHKCPNILIHCIFSTKARQELIPDPLLPRLFRYLNGIGRNIKVPVIAAGGTKNHVHMLIALPVDMTIAKAMQTFKANSSRWIGEHGTQFAWQEGCGAFSVSASLRDTVRNYIEHQSEHHKKRSFEEEFSALLDKCGIDFDFQTLFAD